MPQEAGINERAVSFTKAAMSGRRRSPGSTTAASRIDTCVGCGSPIPPSGARRSCWARRASRLGSACISPRLGPIALALVRREAGRATQSRLRAQRPRWSSCRSIANSRLGSEFDGGTKRASLAVAIAALSAAAGCGDEDFANNPRPPVPIGLTGVIQEDKVTVSPAKVGAGQVTITISNQTPGPSPSPWRAEARPKRSARWARSTPPRSPERFGPAATRCVPARRRRCARRSRGHARHRQGTPELVGRPALP